MRLPSHRAARGSVVALAAAAVVLATAAIPATAQSPTAADGLSHTQTVERLASPAGRRKPAQPVGTTTFRLASINLLGAGHTDGADARPGFAKSSVRLEITKKVMDQQGVDVVGFQEMHMAQARQWTREQSKTWGLFPGTTQKNIAAHNSLSWRLDTFTAVQKKTIAIPYFNGAPFPMPYVLLKNRATGQKAWFINVHNPADTAGKAQKYRDEAIRRESALINRLRAEQPAIPVFLTGDMNDRDKFFCPLVSTAPVAAANGGYADAKVCTPPAPIRVDWVLGTTDTTFTGYTALQDEQVKKASDHAFIMADANIPTPLMRTSPIDHVLVVAVDGLRSDALTKLGSRGAPTLQRLLAQGSGTLNGRTSRESTKSLPNLMSLLSGRRVRTSDGGHGLRRNHDDGTTVHDHARRYVSSVFSMGHNLGHSTSFYSSRARSAIIMRSYAAERGGADPYGIDDGRAKIDAGGVFADDTATATALNAQLDSTPVDISVVEYAHPERVGSASGYGSPAYLAAVTQVDRLVGRTFRRVKRSPTLRGHTLVVLTGLSGGVHRASSDPAERKNYTVPIMVWGPGVAAGRDLYSLNPAWSNPGRARGFYGPPASVQVGDLANLLTGALRMPPLPGSQTNTAQAFAPWTR